MKLAILMAFLGTTALVPFSAAAQQKTFVLRPDVGQQGQQRQGMQQDQIGFPFGPQQGLAAAQLRNQRLYTQAGQEIGRVRKLVQGRNDQVYAVVAAGDRQALVPVDRLAYRKNRFIVTGADGQLRFPVYNQQVAAQYRELDPEYRVAVVGYDVDPVVAVRREREPLAQEQVERDQSRVVVRQPPPTVRVDPADPRVIVQQQQPRVTVNQPQPEILVRQPQPTVTVNIPQPEIIVRMPEPDVNVAMAQPQVRVLMARPDVAVTRPGEPQVQVDEVEPQVIMQRQAGARAQVQVQRAGEPVVRFERAEPRVIVNQARGQPNVRLEQTAAPAAGAASQQPAAKDEARTFKNHHADLTSPINISNVQQMKQAWTFETPAPVSHIPLVEGDRVYFADWGGTVYAVEAKTGKKIWEKKVEQPKTEWPWHGFAGTGALGDGMLFQASVEGNAFALDAQTGEVLWKVKVADDPEAGSISKLTYASGLVFIGLQSVEEPLTKMKEGFKPDFRGKVLALDAETGKLVWERQLVEPPHNGVAMWSSFALDPETGVLYFTTGNNYTGEATDLSDALIAVNGRTGEILWARQVTMHDVWTMADQKGPDYDFAGGPQLFEATINGQPRKLVGAGQKSGIFYVWDRQSGEPVWATNIGYGGIDGGMHGEASIGSDRIIAWSNNNYLHKQPPEKHHASIKALEPATGRHIWVNNKAQPPAIFAAGFLANDVYFLGSLDGVLRAYSAKDGKQIWSTQTPGPIISSIWADGPRVFVSTGVPQTLGEWAKGKNSISAYSIQQ